MECSRPQRGLTGGPGVAIFYPETVTVGFLRPCSILLGREASRVILLCVHLRRGFGLSWGWKLKMLSGTVAPLGLHCVAHPQVRVYPPPPTGSARCAGHGGLGPPRSREPVGTAGARPPETLTAMRKARLVQGFKLQGNKDLEKSPSTRAAGSRVWGPREVWG